jgi:hypothetical protein
VLIEVLAFGKPLITTRHAEITHIISEILAQTVMILVGLVRGHERASLVGQGADCPVAATAQMAGIAGH